MSLLERLPEHVLKPRVAQLKQFGLALPLAVAALCWISGASWTWTIVAIAASVVAAVVGWFRPGVLRPVFVGLSLLALPVGLVIGELVMLCVYWGLMTPLGLAFRLMRRDPLERRIDRARLTYWNQKRRPSHLSSYLRRW